VHRAANVLARFERALVVAVREPGSLGIAELGLVGRLQVTQARLVGAIQILVRLHVARQCAPATRDPQLATPVAADPRMLARLADPTRIGNPWTGSSTTGSLDFL